MPLTIAEQVPQSVRPGFDARWQRIEDCINLRTPDRMPVSLIGGFWFARYGGVSCRQLMYDYELAKREAKASQAAKDRLKIEWGSQIRSYVLFPYQQVNDHRTDLKTSKVTDVLDGDLDELIRTFLLQQGSEANAQN